MLMHMTWPQHGLQPAASPVPKQGGTAKTKPGPSLALLPGEGGRDKASTQLPMTI